MPASIRVIASGGKVTGTRRTVARRPSASAPLQNGSPWRRLRTSPLPSGSRQPTKLIARLGGT
jgi:hypothetical protein